MEDEITGEEYGVNWKFLIAIIGIAFCLSIVCWMIYPHPVVPT